MGGGRLAAALATYREPKICLRSARLLPPAWLCCPLRCNVAKWRRDNFVTPPEDEDTEAKEDEQEDDAEALATQNQTKSACRKVCYAVPSRATVRARVRATTLLSNETEQFETGRHLNLSGFPSFIDTSFPALQLPSFQFPRATVRDVARARNHTVAQGKQAVSDRVTWEVARLEASAALCTATLQSSDIATGRSQ